jgi:hypothetical protein
MIVATPLDLPTVEPDDWDVFWKIWHRESARLVKERMNHVQSTAVVGQSSLWVGVDILKRYNIPTAWTAPFYDISEELPKFYNFISSIPVNHVFRIRLISSLQDLSSHSDDNIDKWVIRALLHCEDPKSQWYFTKPGNGHSKQFFQLPPETNWFSYNDKHCWHGTTYNKKYPKILLQVFMGNNPISLVNSSIEKYKDYVINL